MEMTNIQKAGYTFQPRTLDEDIIAAIDAAGGSARSGKMITRSRLLKRLDNRYRASEIGPALQRLVAYGDVFARKGEAKPRGKPPTLYRLTTFAKVAPKPAKVSVMLAFSASPELSAALREMAEFHGRSLSEEIRERLIYTLGYHGEVVDD